MFEYFDNIYPWNLAVLAALDLGAVASDVDLACRPLRKFTGADDPGASAAWSQNWSAIGDRMKLQARREELLKSIARTEEEGRSADDDPTVDLADKAANSYTKEFLFGQNNTDRATLQLIDEALERIKNNAFGQCEYCETELQQKRLEAVPWARNCTSCQEKHEQGLL